MLKRISKIGTNLAVTLMMEAILSSETPVLTRDARRQILEDVILQVTRCVLSHRIRFLEISCKNGIWLDYVTRSNERREQT
jgi:hypothetical protein